MYFINLENYLMILLIMGKWEDTGRRVRIGRRKFYKQDAHFSEEFSLIISIYIVLSHILYSNTCFIVFQGEDGFPGFKGDMGLKGDRVSEKKISISTYNYVHEWFLYKSQVF